ncbi:MAG: hypothetical protein HC769_03740 [Cyanobacteria bacterium CRU_2_1]|nr:hypothetical protein [Cyanobacteria bacterium CRU_2_1]
MSIELQAKPKPMYTLEGKNVVQAVLDDIYQPWVLLEAMYTSVVLMPVYLWRLIQKELLLVGKS